MKGLLTIWLFVALSLSFASCKVSSKGKSGKNITIKDGSNLTSVDRVITEELLTSMLRARIIDATKYSISNGFSSDYCFLVDLGIASGKNRFFVYDMKKDAVIFSGLVAHGSCNTHYLDNARFSNKPNSGCTSIGKYKVGAAYKGEFGKSYRLYGLDSTNSNAYKRDIVLHSFGPIPDQEIYPKLLNNSFGCPMVSRSFLERVSLIIDQSEKPILLWIFQSNPTGSTAAN
ncbi:MAG: murein L,D-transpeptidase catalytic domain-containing protein [Chitinophagales bacterium]